MLPNDPLFNRITEKWFKHFPFRELSDHVKPNEADDREGVVESFCRVFHAPDAYTAQNIVFFWAVDRPYQHEKGHGFESTISYIEMTKGALARRWPRGYFRNITYNKPLGDKPIVQTSLQQLADKDQNWSFYSRLIREHGPLRVHYATLTELNNVGYSTMHTVREWERTLIKAYRGVHGCRPVKNRRD